jgi:hypothetical protein
MYVLLELALCVIALTVGLVPVGGAAAQQEPAASDGQHLSDQPADVQALFALVWGPAAAQEWANERNAQVARETVPQPAPLNPGLAGPQVTITQPSTGQTVWTANDFSIRGTATDPSAGPQAIDRVEVWLNGRRNTRGAVQVGIATLDGGGGWSLTFSPTKFPAMNSNLYVYSHSNFSGNTSVSIVNFNIADRR